MAAETDGVDLSDPTASALAHFGNEVLLELKRTDTRAGELATAAHCHKTLVSKILAGGRLASRQFAEACDELFPDAHGRFVRLWKFTTREAYPPWFRGYVDLEAKATRIRLFNPHLVPGLVQTEAYARAVLATGRPPRLETAVALRLSRQHILDRNEPPQVWVTLDEGALRRTAGDSEVMREQLERLLTMAATPPHVVQIVPAGRGVYHAGTSPYGVLTFADQPDVVHVDGFPTGYVTGEEAHVAEARSAYDLLTATALDPDESAIAIESIMKEYA